jgi:hypothetical protein
MGPAHRTLVTALVGMVAGMLTDLAGGRVGGGRRPLALWE